MMRITNKSWLIIIAVVLIAGAIFFSEGPKSSTSRESYKSAGIPDNYYLSQQAADMDSPIELVRFATSIKPDARSLNIP